MHFVDIYSWLNWLDNIDVFGAVLNALRTACYWLTSIIYELLVNLYNFFDTLCNARILSNDIISEMSKRIGLILGLVMFFYIVFSMVQMLMDPNKISDKEKGVGSLAKKAIIVIAMLGCHNAFFEILYDVQHTIIDSNAISKLILPYTIKEEDKDKFGNLLSFSLMKAFYYPENFSSQGYTITDQNSDDIESCQNITERLYTDIYYDNKYEIGYMCLKENIEISDGLTSRATPIINFNGILAIAAGAFTVYILFIYCFKVGVRMVQLAFLEIISPMAIVSYMSPKKDNMMTKWWKLYFATYIDVFIRIAIINFVVFLICVIFASNAPTNIFDFFDMGFNSGPTKALFTVIIILSLLTFAKKAPDLLKELLPAGASKLGFGLGMKDIAFLKEGTGMLAGAATGAAIGLLGGVAAGWSGNTGWRKITGLATGALSGTLGGIWNGGKAGASAKGLGKAVSSAREKQAKANLDRAQRHLAGAHWYDNVGNGVNSYFGQIGDYERLDAEVSSYSELKSDVEGEENVKNMLQQANNAYSDFYKRQRDAGVDDALIQSQNEWIEVNYKGKIDEEKDKAYKKLLDSNAAFKEKISMHNRRFGTRYNENTNWEDINKIRKKQQAKLEKQRASKPKK